MPDSVEQARKVVSDNFVNVFYLGNVDLAEEVIRRDYADEEIILGECLERKRPGENFSRCHWVGDVTDPSLDLICVEPVTEAEVNPLIEAGLIKRGDFSIAHIIRCLVKRDHSADTHYDFHVVTLPTFNSRGPRLWTDQSEVPKTKPQPLDEVPFWLQTGGLQFQRFAYAAPAERCAKMLNEHARQELERLGRNWFVERRIFKPAPKEVDGFYWAHDTWNPTEMWEIRAHVADSKPVVWEPDLPRSLQRLMSREEAERHLGKTHW